MAAGYTLNLPEKETYLHPKEYYIDTMAMIFGGYVVEKEVLNCLTSGPSSDLKKVTEIAQETKLTVKAVESRLIRAKRQFREAWIYDKKEN